MYEITQKPKSLYRMDYFLYCVQLLKTIDPSLTDRQARKKVPIFISNKAGNTVRIHDFKAVVKDMLTQDQKQLIMNNPDVHPYEVLVNQNE